MCRMGDTSDDAYVSFPAWSTIRTTCADRLLAVPSAEAMLPVNVSIEIDAFALCSNGSEGVPTISDPCW